MAEERTRAGSERELVDAARTGNEAAFGRIVERFRPELHAHCYRMLGSVQDAEDALQDALLRAWRGLPRFEGRSSARTWLYRIATNACLDAIGRRPQRVLPVDHGPPSEPVTEFGEPLTESVWVEPYPDEELGVADGRAAPEARYEQREAVELAFVAALQHLPPNQRAALILRDVLGFSAREASESLDTTVAAVNSALQRARRGVERRLPDRSQQATIRALGDARLRELVAAYSDTWERGDVAALMSLLAKDAVFSMPPWPMWWRGRDVVAGFASEAAEQCATSVSMPVTASGQVAIAYFHLDEDGGGHSAAAIDVLTLEGDLISEITAFVMPDLFPRFGLPTALAAAPA